VLAPEARTALSLPLRAAWDVEIPRSPQKKWWGQRGEKDAASGQTARRPTTRARARMRLAGG